MPKVYVNGALVEEPDATVSVFDHGLVVGDGVFETILLHKGAAFALRRHLDRLERSAKGLGIKTPLRSVIADAVRTTVDAAAQESGRIRITLTAGRGPLGSGRDDSEPTLVFAIAGLGEVHEVAEVATVPFRRNEFGALAGLKTTSYGENALALAKAAEVGADEAIFANTAGMLCEGTGSNVFVVIDGETLTPPLASGCLAGVTRDLVLESGLGREADIPFSQFSAERLDEAFLTSTLRGVQPIATIDGAALRAAPGSTTKEAALRYAGAVGGGLRALGRSLSRQPVSWTRARTVSASSPQASSTAGPSESRAETTLTSRPHAVTKAAGLGEVADKTRSATEQSGSVASFVHAPTARRSAASGRGSL